MVLAQAVQQVNADAKLGIGPPIRDGFYYDFDVATPFTPDDLKELEKVMQRIINEGQTFVRREVSDEEALAAVGAVRPRMQRSARDGRRVRADRVYNRAGRPCPRCGERIEARGLGDDVRWNSFVAPPPAGTPELDSVTTAIAQRGDFVVTSYVGSGGAPADPAVFGEILSELLHRAEG